MLSRIITKIKSLPNEYRQKRNFFNIIDSFLFTIAPIIKIGNKRKHNEILNNLKPMFMDVYTKCSKVAIKDEYIEDSSIIWACWFQGYDNMPKLVRTCIESIKSNKGTHPFVLITNDNYKEYLDIPEYILKKVYNGIITHTHFSDIIRTGLLSKYGGYWIDATIYVTEPIRNYNMSFYSIRQNIDNQRFVLGGGKWTAFMLACGKSNSIISTVYSFFLEYWKFNDCMIDYFLIDYVFALAYLNVCDFKVVVDNLPLDNENIHELFNVMNDEYDQDKMKELFKNQCSKLSWKTPIKKGNTIINSILN